jgi:hypothetical protein
MFVWLCFLGGGLVVVFLGLGARGTVIAQGESLEKAGESGESGGEIKIEIKEKNWPEGL